MKKYLLLFSVLFLFSMANVFSQTVYINENASKHYHVSTCKYVNKQSTALNLNNAMLMGFTPCKECKPPTDISKPVQKKKIVAPKK